MKHELKIWPQYFCRVADGSKTFEVRVNDRGFQPGDEVDLREWDDAKIYKCVDWTPMGDDYAWVPKGYTGQHITFRIGYVLPIDAERVVFSLLPLSESTR